MTSRHRSTTRLLLRPVAMDDLAAFVALETTLRSLEQPPRDSPDTAESARYLAGFAKVWDEGELGYWTIVVHGRVAGFGGVQPKLWRGRQCWNLYYRIAPELQGQGIATETAREAIAAGFDEHPEWPVLVETRTGNTGAIKVAERAGLIRQAPQPGDDYAVLLLER